MKIKKAGAAESDALVIFGATGDLAHKMVFPSLYALAKCGALSVPVVGVASSDWSLTQLRERVTDFQLAQGLPPDGLAGPLTLMRLSGAAGGGDEPVIERGR